MTRENKWIIKNFSKLVDQYGGDCIAVVKNKIVAVGKNERIVEIKARKKYPKNIPSVMRVPKNKELVCVLNFRIQITKV